MSLSEAQTTDDVAALGEIARRRGLRIAVVESLTSGGLAHAVGAGSDASEWFVGGIVAYMTEVKEVLLGLAAGSDPTSPECAEQLAAGGRDLFAADICVATTGVGGPDSEDGHPAGTVYLGWATEGAHGHRLLELDGSPEDVMATTVASAVGLILDTLQTADAV
ncbi:CinA family protein [Microbacterium aerolatum]|uniref:CinA C-terminal domain-containing protein n=1 Tax=Microbacterium aerolatum TaxID=153731 RepID=A0A511AKZ2_9MICO|nr:nicotinamide-nucleotide amidohydrolase family protein [Microbacterium aerolatum]GEK86557.1 hypothetical protein MAE01_17330 [Microbacterium aerolatum]GGB17849.1 hypothetical protein GCM10007198_05510 [Microbacterium aerolatum]